MPARAPNALVLAAGLGSRIRPVSEAPGVYVVEKDVLDLIPPGRLGDFGWDVFPAMLAQGRSLHGHVLESSGFCLGLNTPESYAEGRRLLREGAVALA